MKIYKSRIPIIAADVARALIDAEAVEVAEEQKSLFIQDIADVLTSYIETERKIHEEAQDLIANRNVDFSSLGRFKRELVQLRLGRRRHRLAHRPHHRHALSHRKRRRNLGR